MKTNDEIRQHIALLRAKMKKYETGHPERERLYQLRKELEQKLREE